MLKSFARSACGAILLFAFVLPAHAELNPAAALPLSPQLVTGKLPNGLTYYIQKNSRPVPPEQMARLMSGEDSLLRLPPPKE